MAQPSDRYESMLRALTPIDATEALRRLQALVQSKPNLRIVEDDYSLPQATLRWLGELHAVVAAMKRAGDEMALKVAIDTLARTHGSEGRGEISVILYRALTAAELGAPASEQGAFIAAGNELDAYAAIAKVMATAEKSILVVDPYMDGKALSDFMPSAAEQVTVRILSDEASLKPTLMPA